VTGAHVQGSSFSGSARRASPSCHLLRPCCSPLARRPSPTFPPLPLLPSRPPQLGASFIYTNCDSLITFNEVFFLRGAAGQRAQGCPR
jgi:hypothetical protein